MTTITAEDLTPRVWIGSLRMYNGGHLVGHWFDADGADEVTEAEVFRGSGFTPDGDEELWCFDIENIPTRREMSPHEAARWGEALTSVDEHLRAALHAWVASGDYVAVGTGDLPSVSDFEERFAGHWDSFSDYVRELADDIGLLRDVPEEVQSYFDWDRYARDLQYDYSVIDAPSSGVFIFRSY